MTFDLAGQTAAQNVTMASFSYTKTASGLETSIAKGDLTLNGVEILNTDISNSFGGKLNLINSFSAETGVVASATFDQTLLLIQTTSSKVMSSRSMVLRSRHCV